MSNLPIFTSELSIYKSNNNYSSNYYETDMTNSNHGVSPQAIIAPKVSDSDLGSTCRTVCFWSCEYDAIGGVDFGCILECMRRCSVFDTNGSSRFSL